MDKVMTPPPSIVRSDSVAADERLQEDGVQTGHILVGSGDLRGNLIDVDVPDESTITFRRYPEHSDTQGATRLDLNRTCDSQSGDSDVADEVETEPEGYDKSPKQPKINAVDTLPVVEIRPRRPAMGKLSLSHGTNKNMLRSRPSPLASSINRKAKVKYSQVESANDRSNGPPRRLRTESTDSDDGDGAAPSSARRLDAGGRARAT